MYRDERAAYHRVKNGILVAMNASTTAMPEPYQRVGRIRSKTVIRRRTAEWRITLTPSLVELRRTRR